jgi:phosphoglycolate phosphatase-like HAD superfamily hydrolase
VKDYKFVFWDFDGVIKESVEIKTEAFANLFKPFGESVLEKIRRHHLSHGGISRYKKIPLYLQWSGQEVTDERLDKYLKAFKSEVFQGVLNARWVPGVESILRSNPYDQNFFLISATPKQELVEIVKELSLEGVFLGIYGSPETKSKAIYSSINLFNIPINEAVMIGDSEEDYNAARDNEIAFILRRHSLNEAIMPKYNGAIIENFKGI